MLYIYFSSIIKIPELSFEGLLREKKGANENVPLLHHRIYCASELIVAEGINIKKTTQRHT